MYASLGVRFVIGVAAWTHFTLSVPKCCGGQLSSRADPQKGQTAAGIAGPLDASIVGDTYINHFFGFSLTFPKGWIVVPNGVSSRGSQANGFSGVGGGSEKDVNANPDGTLTLLVVVEKISDRPSVQWRRVLILANKLQDPNVSIEDHLRYGSRLLREKHSSAQMVGEPQPVDIAGRKLWKQKMTQVENGITYHLLMYSTISRNFSLQFILWGVKDNDANELQAILNALQFL